MGKGPNKKGAETTGIPFKTIRGIKSGPGAVPLIILILRFLWDGPYKDRFIQHSHKIGLTTV